MYKEHILKVEEMKHECEADVGMTFLSTKRRRIKLVEKLLIVATLTFGLRPRQGGCKVASLEVDPGVTSHAPGNAKSLESVRE